MIGMHAPSLFAQQSPNPRWIAVLTALLSIFTVYAQQATLPSESKEPVRKKALLIGNSNYKSLPVVGSAGRDVQVIESALRQIGFDPTVSNDLTAANLETIDNFVHDLRNSDIVFFYFAGHAAQWESENFLLPVDYDPAKSLEDIALHAYSLKLLFQLLGEKDVTKVVVLDASRALPEAWPLAKGAPPGISSYLMAFSDRTDASEPGDQNSQPGIFAQSLASELQRCNLSVPELFENVKDAVSAATAGRQQVDYPSDGLASLRLHPCAPPKPGPQTNVPKRNNIDNQDYVWIPEGTFEMGCVPEDKKCEADEKPQHMVRMTKGYWMGRLEVTVDAYSTYARVNRIKMPGAPLTYHGWNNAGGLPMVNVRWTEAQAFCKWAGGRLPTEAEWEYAARAGAETIYPWGDEITHDQAQFNWPVRGNNTGRDISEGVATAGHYAANKWGLLDVVGNVREWVSDWYKPGYDDGLAIDPKGPSDGKERVLRGGSFHSNEEGVRLSKRDHRNPQAFDNQSGFRCVLEKLD
jgi:formylglycine-generating enzyme